MVRCPECGSENTHARRRTGDWLCLDCDLEFQAGPEGAGNGPGVGAPARRRVFLSYGHDEQVSLALRLKADLEGRGHEVWFDVDRLKPGGDWEAYIEEGIQWAAQDSSGCVLLLMTPHSVRRPDGYCLNEVARAVEKNLFTVPVMVVQVEPPLSIARLQWFDMTACVPLAAAGSLYEDRREILFQALESGRVDFEGAQARLLRLLRPIEFRSDKTHHLRHFVGRGWVLERIQAWLSLPPGAAGSRVFWITGAPGVGKTALSVWLAGRALPAIKAWHLCQHNHDVNRDPQRCVASIICYLSRLLPDYFELLKNVELESVARMSASTLFKEALVEPLKKAAVPASPVVILIDALDEAASQDGRNELAEFIGAEFEKAPEWLRLIVTSRPVREVEESLSHFHPLRVEADTPENLRDIKCYVRARLKSAGIRGAAASAAVRAVAERSGGVFLYARTVCDEVEAGRLDVARPDLFPKGLSAVYLAFFRRQFPDVREYRELFAPALELAAAALEPLTISMLAERLGWTERLKRRFQDGVGALFQTHSENGPVEPFHKSVMDWATGSAPSDYFIGRQDGAVALADWGWGEYRSRGPARMRPYFLRQLPVHLAETDRPDELAALMEDLEYLEEKIRTGMAFQLPRDAARALEAAPAGSPHAGSLALLHGTIRREVHFLAGHSRDYPQALFQCLWNACGREDPDASTLSALLENHLAARQQLEPGFPWVRCLRPRPFPAGLSSVVRHLGHVRAIQSVRFSPDGERIVSGSSDKTVRVWDAQTGKCFHILKGHTDAVTGAVFSEDGAHIASGSEDRTVRVWDARTGKCLHVLKGHRAAVTGTAFSDEGTLVMSGSEDATVRVWSARTGKCLRVLKGHEAPVTGVSQIPHTTRLASVSADKTLRVWDARDGRSLLTLRGHTQWVGCVAVSPDGQRIASGSGDSRVLIWDAATGERTGSLEGHAHAIADVAFSSDGKRVASGSWDGSARVWDAASGICLQALPTEAQTVRCVSYAPGGQQIAGAVGDQVVHVWDVEQDGRTPSPSRESDGEITCLTFSPCGGQVAVGHDNHAVRVWDAESGACAGVLSGHEDLISCVAFSPDGEHLASGSWDESVRIWSTRTGECLRMLEGHTDNLACVAFSPDGELLASGSWDATVRVWNVSSGVCPVTFSGHASFVDCAAFSPDGLHVASGSRDRTIQIWSARTGECVRRIKTALSHPVSLAFSPDGTKIAAQLSNETACLWEVLDGTCLAVVPGGTDVRALAAGPETHPFLAFARGDETVMTDAATESPVAWFPAAVKFLSAHPSRPVWVGALGSDFCLLRLEEGWKEEASATS